MSGFSDRDVRRKSRCLPLRLKRYSCNTARSSLIRADFSFPDSC
nr:MAG TPA_asm: hypothetical protein [Caudoviricetes sp.]